jgi:hypothetical protein
MLTGPIALCIKRETASKDVRAKRYRLSALDRGPDYKRHVRELQVAGVYNLFQKIT